jgi:hypothetical protein
MTAEWNCPTNSFSAGDFLTIAGRGIGVLNIVRELYNTYIDNIFMYVFFI